MAADTLLAPAVLDFVTKGAYPESETTAAASLDGTTLAKLLSSLRQAQEQIKSDIRSLSRDTAPDIDTWISRAKLLQADIVRSRDIAHQIVADAEAVRSLQADVKDAENKVQLLEREVAFNGALTETLEHISDANGSLDRVEEDLADGDPVQAQIDLARAESNIAGLENIASSNAYEILSKRCAHLKEGAKETLRECWDALVRVDTGQRAIRIHSNVGTTVQIGGAPALNLSTIVKAAEGLSIDVVLAQRLARDIERVIIRPLTMGDRDRKAGRVNVDGEIILVSEEDADPRTKGRLRDLSLVLKFFATRLPTSISISLSRALIPSWTSRLEERHLSASIPMSISEIPAFQDVLAAITALAMEIDDHGWEGAARLRNWVQSAPKLWLAKRREALLGDVRTTTFTGLRETEVVERTETRVFGTSIEQNNHVAEQDDEWGTAWDDGNAEEEIEATTKAKSDTEGDDEASAWDLDDEEVTENTDSNSNSGKGGGEEDAWGWNEDDKLSVKASSPVASNKEHPLAEPNGDSRQTAEQEVVLRERYTITAIPVRLLVTIQAIIADAQTLATDPSLAGSPIASAASALYTLPTLALAIYRATAPTTYSRLPNGNMLIYNDASHLARLLREWQASQPPGTRLRIENDVKALDAFAKRAYASEMDSQRTILKDILDGAQGFANCTTLPFKAECESAVAQTVDRLRDVHKQWTGILSDGALLQSLGSLLATATDKMIREIEDLGDISEVDSKELKQLCEKTMAVRDIFATPASNSNGESQDMTFVYCPGWLKFQYLSEIMDGSLADIKWMWTEGELSLEFDVDEVVELVEALFAESDLRRRAVTEIRRGGRR